MKKKKMEKRTALKKQSIKMGERDVRIYKINIPVKFKNIDGTFGETHYILVSRLITTWVDEVVVFACNPNGRLLDSNYEPVFSEDNVTEKEALEKNGYTVIK